MDVVIYARYSPGSGQDEQSIEGQLDENYKYCELNNLNVVGEYIDRGKSGKSDNRDDFLKMIEDSKDKNKTWNGIVVYKLDRFARDKYDSVFYKRELKKNDVRVLSSTEKISDDASGILMESILEGMAEYYSVELGEKVKRGMGVNAKKCYYNGGTVPIGFKLEEAERLTTVGNKEKIKWRYAIDNETAPIVKNIFNMYINGDTMADIVRYLNNQQIKTSRGNTFNKNSINRILLDTKYIGTYSYNGIEVTDGIPQLIDHITFERVKETMEKSKKTRGRTRAKAEYLLTTKLFCGHCKDMMVGISGTSKTGKLYNYYQCKKSRLKLCDKKVVQKDYIEDLVINEARKVLDIPQNIEKIVKSVIELVDKEKDNININRLNKVFTEYTKKQDNLIKAVTECDIESVRKTLYQELSKIEKDIKDTQSQINIEQSRIVKLDEDEITYFLEKLRDGDTNDIKYRKMIINVLVNSVYLYDDKVIIVFNTQDSPVEMSVSLVNDMEETLTKSLEVRMSKQSAHQFVKFP